ncbi:MAG TPA: molecular chaperone TorD family protein [Actinomycetes bacterium]|jgi:TorA maturation chaperone TorD|nr:molecular chaperone TorD family protein [Actinomycetes bacterium]
MPAAPELLRALGVLCEPPEPAHARVAEALCLPGPADPADHTELFGFQLVPYASVYLGAEGMLGGEAADRVAGFWRALRLTPPPEPDHLAALLGLYATLGEAERGERDPARRALWLQARRALLWEQLLTWAVAYARAVAGAAAPFHAAWAELLERTLLAEAAGLEPPATPPLHLRDAPGLPEPGEGAGTLVGALLAPVRSGLILTRWDLARGAAGLGLGLRMGERAFALRSLLAQDPRATLAWLAGEAAGWAARHRRTEATLGDTGRHWRQRAEAAQALLLELERATEEVTAHAAGR